MHQSYSLSEFLSAVQMAIKANFTESYWIRAEISSLSAKPGGHCYMELVESVTDGRQDTFSAKIRANCWRNRWAVIAEQFATEAAQPLRVGMKVMVQATIDFSPVYGMSLNIQDLDPTFTIGDLAKQKQEALRRLEEEGIIDMQQMLTLPTLPQRLAIISSATAAGYQDFIHQLENNEYGYAFRTRLFEALMQGDRAADSIIAALDEIYAISEAYAEKHGRPAFDAVVLIRGGGANTDLSCFDQYSLAANCAQFPLPIISGVGHTRDVSVVDRVAFHAVKTPTAAAEYLISLLEEQDTLLQELGTRLHDTARRQIQQRRNTVDRLNMQIEMLIGSRLQRDANRLDLIERTISLHSPERIFRMGYSLTMCSGQIVRSADSLSDGDVMTTIFSDGTAESVVRKP